MRILGIDPGTGICGFGIVDADGSKLTMVDAGIIKTAKDKTDQERLVVIYDALRSLIKQHQPQWAAVEKLYFAQNVTTAMTVSQARGVVLLAAEQAGLEVAEYTPLQIKQSLTGYGRASKQQIQEMVKVVLGLHNAPKSDDCADALAAAISHAMFSRPLKPRKRK